MAFIQLTPEVSTNKVRFHLVPESKQELSELIERYREYAGLDDDDTPYVPEYELFENLCSNSEWDLIDEDPPCMVFEAEYEENEFHVKSAANVYIFDMYATQDVADQLLKNGYVDFIRHDPIQSS